MRHQDKSAESPTWPTSRKDSRSRRLWRAGGWAQAFAERNREGMMQPCD